MYNVHIHGMVIAVIEIDYTFYMLPSFEQDAIELWGEDNLEEKLQEIGDSLYKGDHLGNDVWKVRVGAKGKGKRSGARVIYALFLDDRSALMIDLYGKSDKDDLTKEEEKELKEFIRGLSIKGVKNDDKNKARKVKAKLKERRGVRRGKSGTATKKSKSKSSGRKKNKK